MSNNEGGETSNKIKMILLVLGIVILWVVLQSFTGVPMKM
jgi:hypothetical protein